MSKRSGLNWERENARVRGMKSVVEGEERIRTEEGPPCKKCGHVKIEHHLGDDPPPGGVKKGCNHEIWFKKRWHDCPCEKYELA